MTPVVELDLVATAPVSVGARAWSHRGRYRLTAIVKAAFTLVQDGPMRIAAPTPLVVRDELRGQGGTAASRKASELALYLRRPEILLDAIAFPPKGQTVEQMKVRLAIARGDRMLLSKELLVLGDRTSIDGQVPRPVPLAKMPIVYERAFGGNGNAANPAGVGTEAGGRITMPNLMGGDGARAEPFGFGPISASWPARRLKLGATARMDAEEAVFIGMPDAFDETFFQAAPLDQQVDDLLPGDMLVFVGMHPDIPTLRVAIPAVRGVAIAEADNGRRVQVPMRLDTVFVEPHAMRAELVFRGVIEMTPELLRGLKVAGALEEPPTPYRFPPLYSFMQTARRVRGGESMSPVTQAPASTSSGPSQQPSPRMPPGPAGPGRAGVGTMMLDDGSSGGAAPASRPAVTGTMIVDEGPPIAARPKATFGTLPLSGPTDPVPSSLPFRRPPPSTRRRSSMKIQRANVVVPAKVIPAQPGVMSTMVLDAEPEPVEPVAPPQPVVISEAHEPAPEPIRPARPAIQSGPVVIEEHKPPPMPESRSGRDLADILAEKQAENEKAAASKPAESVPQPKSAVWAEPTNEMTKSPPKSAQAPRPVVQPAPDRKAQLYKKFKT